MNAASRGVVLAVAAVILGVIILGQGFSDPEPVVAAAPGDDAGDGSTGDAIEPPADDSAADGGGDTAADDTATETPADDSTADGGGDTGADDTATETPAADDSTADGEPTTPEEPQGELHDPAEVRVLVVNGTSVGGAAGTVNNELIALGYNGLSPTNTNPAASATATMVYYSEGFEIDARQLAQSLNAPATAVAPLPDQIPVDDLLEANVVIILGPDLVPGA